MGAENQLETMRYGLAAEFWREFLKLFSRDKLSYGLSLWQLIPQSMVDEVINRSIDTGKPPEETITAEEKLKLEKEAFHILILLLNDFRDTHLIQGNDFGFGHVSEISFHADLNIRHRQLIDSDSIGEEEIAAAAAIAFLTLANEERKRQVNLRIGSYELWEERKSLAEDFLEIVLKKLESELMRGVSESQITTEDILELYGDFVQNHQNDAGSDFDLATVFGLVLTRFLYDDHLGYLSVLLNQAARLLYRAVFNNDEPDFLD